MSISERWYVSGTPVIVSERSPSDFMRDQRLHRKMSKLKLMAVRCAMIRLTHDEMEGMTWCVQFASISLNLRRFYL